MKIDNVIFYCPCKTTGGGQYLFIRYADAITKYYPDLVVYFIDYLDGFARKQLSGNNRIKFLTYSSDKRINIPEKSVVINPLNHLRHFKKNIYYNHLNTTFIFWCIAFGDLYVNKKAVSSREIKKMGVYYSSLLKQNNIIFLGQSLNYRYSLQFRIPFHPMSNVPLLVPVDSFGPKDNDYQLPKRPLRFCWLGRLDSDKYYDIINYMLELEHISMDNAISFSLIGSGKCENQIKNDSNNYSYPISFVGEKRDMDLDYYIRNNVDIGLASGTSSLEFMLRGKPVIQSWNMKRIYAYDEYTAYHFPFEEFDAKKTTFFQTSFVGESTFKNKFNELMKDYVTICDKSYNYAMEKSPYKGALNLVSVIKSLEQINFVDTNGQIEKLSSLMSTYHKRRRLFLLLKNIFKLTK